MQGAPDKQQPPRARVPRKMMKLPDTPEVEVKPMVREKTGLFGFNFAKIERAVMERFYIPPVWPFHDAHEVMRFGRHRQFANGGFLVARKAQQMDEAIRREMRAQEQAHLGEWGRFIPEPINLGDIWMREHRLHRGAQINQPVMTMPRPTKAGILRLKELKARLEDFWADKIDESLPSWERRDIQKYIGLRSLGSGHYSWVFALGTKFALKIVKSNDGGYKAFTDICVSSRNKHLPRIYYRGKWGGHDVYIMERLSPANYAARQHLQDAIRMVNKDNGNPYVTVTCPHVKEVAALLQGKTNDLRIDNVLARADGTPVVTDPYHVGDR